MIVKIKTGLLFTAAFCVLLTGAAGAQGTWTSKPSPRVRAEVAAVEIGGKIYGVGGGTFSADGKLEQYASPLLQEYDPATNQWRDLAPMPQGLSHAGVTALNGKLYVAGGFTIGPPSDPMEFLKVGGHRGAVTSFYSYDPAANRWQELAPLLSPRGSVGLAAAGGKIHAIGGRGLDQKTIAIHEVYDPATGKWSPAPPMPTARDHLGIAVVDGLIHVVGGRDVKDANLTTHEIFDPASGKWTTGAPVPTARSGAAAVAHRGLIVYAGGECKDPGNGPIPFNQRRAFDENEAFDTKTGKWMTLAPLPESRHANGAVAIGDSVYFLGGTHLCAGFKPAKDVAVLKLP